MEQSKLQEFEKLLGKTKSNIENLGIALDCLNTLDNGSYFSLTFQVKDSNGKNADYCNVNPNIIRLTEMLKEELKEKQKDFDFLNEKLKQIEGIIDEK